MSNSNNNSNVSFQSGKSMHVAISKRFSSTLDFANVDVDLATRRKIQPNYAYSKGIMSVLERLDASERLGYQQCYALLNGDLPNLPAPLVELVKSSIRELGLTMPTSDYQFSTDQDVRKKAQLEAKQRIASEAKAIDWSSIVA